MRHWLPGELRLWRWLPMSVHVGRITSEVHSTAPAAAPADSAEGAEEASPWEERIRLAGLLEATERDRLRTATGAADD